MSNALQEFDEHVRGFAQSKNLSDRDLLANFAMGLFGEVGEVTDLLKKHLYHGDPIDKANLIKECGDVCWYWFALLQTLEFNPDSSLRKLTPIDKYTASEEELGVFILPMCVAAGKVVEMMDLYLYYNANNASTDSGNLMPEMRNILRNLFYILNNFGISLETVLSTNIEKLRSRHGGTAFNRKAQRLSKALEGSDRPC